MSVHFLVFSLAGPLFLLSDGKIEKCILCLVLLKGVISFTGPRQLPKFINAVILSVIMSLGTGELFLYLTLEWNMTDI